MHNSFLQDAHQLLYPSFANEAAFLAHLGRPLQDHDRYYDEDLKVRRKWLAGQWHDSVTT